MKKGYKLRKWKEPRFVLKVNVPWIESESCYECGGGWHLIRKEIVLFKWGEVEKRRYISPMEATMEVYYKQLTDKIMENWGKTYDMFDSYKMPAERPIKYHRYGDVSTNNSNSKTT